MARPVFTHRNRDDGERLVKVQVTHYVREQDVAGILASALLLEPDDVKAKSLTRARVLDFVRNYCWANGSPEIACEPEWLNEYHADLLADMKARLEEVD